MHAIYYDHLHLVSIRRDERVDRKREREEALMQQGSNEKGEEEEKEERFLFDMFNFLNPGVVTFYYYGYIISDFFSCELG